METKLRVKDNQILIWVGNHSFQTLQQLRDYVTPKYDANGNIQKSQFMQDFSISNYDTLKHEINFISYPQNIVEVIKGHSYSITFIDDLKKYLGENIKQSIDISIIIYDYCIDDDEFKKLKKINKENLTFLGQFSFKKIDS